MEEPSLFEDEGAKRLSLRLRSPSTGSVTERYDCVGMSASKRTRRTAEGARREILDAAEKRLRELGPDGVRLQQIASDVGVSHPAILHHFESFEGLIQQVVQRAV